MVKESGGIEYAQQKMLQYRDEALTILHELPDKQYPGGARNTRKVYHRSEILRSHLPRPENFPLLAQIR